MTDLVIGIDPGATGAIAILGTDSQLHDIIDLPAVTGSVDGWYAIANTFDAIATHDDVRLAVIEGVRSRPGQGVASVFKFGRCLGVLEGLVAAQLWRAESPAPSTWKKDMGLSKDKDTSRHMAMRLWPDHTHRFSRVKDDGRAEAALMAEWGRRLLVQRGLL